MRTWRLGVVGSPIEHSLSPQLHVAGLAYLGLEGTSERLDVDLEHAHQLRGMMGERFDALAVTMPLKERAAALCDDLEERAAALGVVNSLLWRDDRLLGASTDGAGFLDSLRGEFGVGVSGAHVVVLGSGGAARAIVDALVREGASAVSVLGRNADTVTALVNAHRGVVDHTLIYRPVELIVNTTPSSSRVHHGAALQGVSRETIAVDITYEPRQSPWLAQHAAMGCRTRNGLSMLAYTVARQMNWWWDSDIPGAHLLSTLTEAPA